MSKVMTRRLFVEGRRALPEKDRGEQVFMESKYQI